MSKTKSESTTQNRRTVEEHFADIVSVATMVPLGDPLQPHCHYGLKACFWGPSGIAKSDQIHQGAARVGLEARVIIPGQRQPEDFGGAPTPQYTASCYNGEWNIRSELEMHTLLKAVRDLNSLGKGILFVDEASTAAPAVQGAMLTMINDGVVGDTEIQPGVRILLAANPPEMSAGGWGFEPPMANRIAHFFVACPSVQRWIKWLMTEGADQELTPISKAEELLKKNWGTSWAKVKGALAGYMIKFPQNLHNQPPTENPNSGFNWPSPRTWVFAGRSVATIRALGMKEELEEIFVEACVGEGPTVEFMEYLANSDLPEPKDVLTKGWKIDISRLDKVYAVYTSMVTFLKGIQDTQERYDLAALAWKRLHELHAANIPDLAVDAASNLVMMGLGRTGVPAHVKAAADPVLLALSKDGLSKFTL